MRASNKLRYINFREEHAKLIYSWRIKPHITKFALTDMEEDFEKHKKWLKKIIKDESCKYWIISFEGKNIGAVNLSDIDFLNKRCTAGCYIGEKEFIGLGALFLPPVYDYVFKKLKLNKIYGEVLEGNDLILGIHEFHGWRNVGVYKNHVIKSGKYFDVHLVELLSTEWKNYRTRKGNKEKDSVFKSYELFELNDGIDDSI